MEQAMPFHDRLIERTAEARRELHAAPIIEACLHGQVALPSYLAFLGEAYHHVRHTVPLLQATRDALPARHAWLRGPLEDYIAEERGHEEWILDDIRACGGDAERVRNGRPGLATARMVGFACDTIARGNPLGFFGMVFVLEGTSVALAERVADTLQQRLGLPDSALRYLRSHGALDIEHTAHFARLMDRIADPADQTAIVQAARLFYRLYGDVLRSVPLPPTGDARRAA
jgi:pyrroloquinoline quinone (PQQ) biosynthesis protein C